MLRRLNRTEYETTLRDLLASRSRSRTCSPTTTSRPGSTTSARCSTSRPRICCGTRTRPRRRSGPSIPKRPQVAIQERRTGQQITEKLTALQELLGKSARLDGDALVMYVRNPDYIPCATAAGAGGRPLPRAGLGSAVGTDGKPLPMMFVCRVDLYGREDTDVRTVRDVPAGKPTMIEDEFDLRKRQVMVFAGWSLPHDAGVRARSQESPARRTHGTAGPGRALGRDRRPARPLAAGRLSAPLRGRAARSRKSVAKARWPQDDPARRSPPSRPDGWWIYDPLVPASAKPREDAERLIRIVPAAGLPPAGRRGVEHYYVKIVHAALDKGVPFADAMVARLQGRPLLAAFPLLHRADRSNRGGNVAPSSTTTPSPRGSRTSSGRRCPTHELMRAGRRRAN